MNKKNITNVLNAEMLQKIFDSKLDDNYYVINDAPCYSLKECLNKVSKDVLDLLYINYYLLPENSRMPKDKVTDEAKIQQLYLNLPIKFIECFEDIIGEVIGIFTDVLKNGYTEMYNEMLLTNGFMFAFKEKNKIIYIIPNEIMDIYKANYTEESKKNIINKTVKEYLKGYLLINGIIPKKVMLDFIVKKHNLDITMDILDEVAKSQGINYYRDYYNMLPNEKDVLKLLIKAKKNLSYYYLDSGKLSSYYNFFESFIGKLHNIFKDDEKTGVVLTSIFISYYSAEDLVEDLNKEMDFNKKTKNKLYELIEENWSRFRFWTLNGRTILAFRNEMLIDVLQLKAKPKNNSLYNCLSLLSKENYSKLANLYSVSSNIKINDFVKLISEHFQKEVFNYTNQYMEFLIRSNNVIIRENSLENYDLAHGYIYFYKDGNEKRFLIPNEILDILKLNVKQ